MKFSGNGLYIEEYIKCSNCGYLIYETDLDKAIKTKNKKLFCSSWCEEWHGNKENIEKNKAE